MYMYCMSYGYEPLVVSGICGKLHVIFMRVVLSWTTYYMKTPQTNAKMKKKNYLLSGRKFHNNFESCML